MLSDWIGIGRPCVECVGVTGRGDWETCLPVQKRRHVAALHRGRFFGGRGWLRCGGVLVIVGDVELIGFEAFYGLHEGRRGVTGKP